jgi:gas vesicle protein
MISKKLIAGVFAGMAAGLVAGILYAPEKGSVTRRKLSRKGQDVLDALRDNAYILAAYANQINNEIDRMSDKAIAAAEDARDKAAEKVGKYFRKGKG